MDSDNEAENVLDSSVDLFDEEEFDKKPEPSSEHLDLPSTNEKGVTGNDTENVTVSLETREINQNVSLQARIHANGPNSLNFAAPVNKDKLLLRRAPQSESRSSETNFEDTFHLGLPMKKQKSDSLGVSDVKKNGDVIEISDSASDGCPAETVCDLQELISKENTKTSTNSGSQNTHQHEAKCDESTGFDGQGQMMETEAGACSESEKVIDSTVQHTEAAITITQADGEISGEIACPFCDVKATNLYLLELHIQTEHMVVSNDCAASGYTMVPEASLDGTHDLPVNVEGDPFQFVCPLCGVDLGDAVTLDLHLTEMHAEDQNSPVRGQESCPLCDVTCMSEQAMRQHIRTHGDDQTFWGISAAHDQLSVYETTAISGPPELSCPMCGLKMSDPDLLTSHVESHFNPQHSPGSRTNLASGASGGNKENVPVKRLDKEESSSSQRYQELNVKQTSSQKSVPSTSRERWPASSSKNNVSYKRQYQDNLERAVVRGELSVAQYHEQKLLLSQTDLQGQDNGHTRTQGLIDQLQALYNSQARPNQTIHLCSQCDHFSGSYGDKGWGCGYRNVQMLLSCLINNPDFACRIFPDVQVFIPSIPKLQQMIESAWRKGFDPQGCQQLKGRLVDTRKWIGATEIVTLLSSLGVKCRLIDFHAPSSADGTHPRLFEWVTDYFTVRSQRFLPPLYLQHQGHSRTIVGVEQDKGTTRLLIFDPGTPSDHMKSIAKGHLSWKHMRTFRRTQAGFKAKQYQIVAVVGLLTDAEYRESMTLRSERVS